MRSVLVDTGPLYALVDPDDRHHTRAQEDVDRLTEAGLSMTVAYPTLLEAHSLVLRRLGTRVAQRWLGEMADGVGLLNPRREDYLEAARRVQGYPDQPITLFDAVIACLSDDLRLPVWTYDHHFDAMRVSVWR